MSEDDKGNGDEDEEIEMPRSHSLPNLGFNQECEDYQYVMNRDFRGELANYYQLKKEKEKKKQQELYKKENGGSN